jgi:putative ATP-dependent endonuclease of OLD family
MHLSRIRIINFRNFSEIDVQLSGDIVVVGENRVGKSNLIYALRLIFDPTLPDSARQLSQSDFWDGLEEPDEEDKIIISVEIKEFEHDLDVLALLTDFRIDNDPNTVRLTYEFRPKAGLEGKPASDDDYEFVCYGGESEKKRFGHEVRRRITMDLLPALRDAEGDLATWRRSPLRPLIESAFSGVDRGDLEGIKDAIEAATTRLGDFETVEKLEENLGALFAAMSGPKQDIKPRLGFGTTDVTRLFRNIRLLIDNGRRTINDASLGSANIVFLTLKALELKRLMGENRRDHTLLAIEEPEAHLHPHLQRSVYRHLFEVIGSEEEGSPLSILLTTHSPHIASVAPLRSILLLKDAGDEGTVGRSTAGISITDAEEDDLSRYLDVTRAEMLFARGIILVEGDAEKFLLPVFAETMGRAIDHLGITVCSVAGTNFQPYAKFLTALGIPFAVVTDWDPRQGKQPLGFNRALNLVKTIEQVRTGRVPTTLLKELDAIEDGNEFGARCEAFGVFTNFDTLEVDLFKQGEFTEHIIGTLREQKLSSKRQGWIDGWKADPERLNVDDYLTLIDAVGKGRFAQRLATRVAGIEPPDYIKGAIEFVASRV